MRVDPTRCSARPATGFTSRCGRSTADASRSPRRRSASAQAALDAAIAHAKPHEAFGQPIANYQAIQWMLADMRDRARRGADADAEGGGRARVAARPTLEAAMAKLVASEAAHRAADRAMQILASHGYRRGSLVERLFRDVRATEIYQGTSEVQRMVIAEQLGLAS